MKRGASPFTLPAVVIATGPSLSDAQLELIAAARVEGRCWAITVNNAHARAPWTDLAYFGDYLFGKVHMQAMQRTHAGRIVTIAAAAAERWKLFHVKASNKPGLGMGEAINMNGNSGFQALNLAAWLGAKKVALIGFDMRAVDGKPHYFGQHAAPLVQTQLFEEWCHKARAIAADAKWHGIEVLNATPGSALQCFPMADLAEALR